MMITAPRPEFEVQRHTPDGLLRRIAGLYRRKAKTHRYTILQNRLDGSADTDMM
jgi:hypothetical protein